MLKHCVLLQLKSTEEIQPVRAAIRQLTALVDQIEGMLDLSDGHNRDFEARSSGYSYGFIVTFSDRFALEAYARHPVHVRAGSQLIEACRGGIEGILVADLEVGQLRS